MIDWRFLECRLCDLDRRSGDEAAAALATAIRAYLDKCASREIAAPEPEATAQSDLQQFHKIVAASPLEPPAEPAKPRRTVRSVIILAVTGLLTGAAVGVRGLFASACAAMFAKS